MKDAKDYDPNVDKAGYQEVPSGQCEQVKNSSRGEVPPVNIADTAAPGTAFVPQGNKTEEIVNPPYQTPELGDAPEEMKKEADRIYKALRKEQFHEETPAARESAARVMWSTLEKNWKKGKDGKWVKKTEA
mgnify:CR=1 FL=1